MSKDVFRPIIGIESRTAQEVFDIMCDRFRAAISLPAQEPVAWRTEYRDVYRGNDTGWHYRYSEAKPNPTPLVNGCGHKNVTLLYASPQPEAVITDETVERALSSWWGADPGPTDTSYRDAMRAALTAALLPTHKPLQEEG